MQRTPGSVRIVVVLDTQQQRQFHRLHAQWQARDSWTPLSRAAVFRRLLAEELQRAAAAPVVSASRAPAGAADAPVGASDAHAETPKVLPTDPAFLPGLRRLLEGQSEQTQTVAWTLADAGMDLASIERALAAIQLPEENL
jgi:hypothetical protein